MRRTSTALVLAGLALASRPAAAHISLMEPAPRHAMQKSGPCGAGPGDTRGDNVTVLQAGDKIVVRWTETVDHPGHFRISFDADGQDDFVDPASFDELNSNAAVLVDGIADKSGQNSVYEQEITLPNIDCDNCTLQLIQMMTDKAPYGDGNDLYYQCADIVLQGAAAGTTGESDGTTTIGDATTGGTTGDATTDGGTGHASHGGTGIGDPTTGAGGDDTSGGAGGTAGESSSGGPATDGDDATGDVSGDDEASGCSCRSDASGAAGLWALVLLPALGRRRKRAR